MRRTMATVISIPVSILFVLSVLLTFAGVCAHDPVAPAKSLPAVLRADGDPAPPFPRPRPRVGARMGESTWIADGDPAPPFPRPPLPPIPGLGRSGNFAAARGEAAAA